jgi:hypothetical protein
MSPHSSNETLGLTNAVWDDGEWMSWAEINHYVEVEAVEADRVIGKATRKSGNPEDLPTVEHSPEIWGRLMKLIRQADEARVKGENIGSQIGEIGEVFAEAKFGVKRHRRYAQGSDGKIGNDFVEVKTFSPWKKVTHVRVKLAGHWTKLILVRISDPWIFEAKIFTRSELVHMKGCKRVTANWKPRKQTVLQGRDEATAGAKS